MQENNSNAYQGSNFKDNIIKDYGEMTISSTQKYRVLLVDSADGLGVRLSVQKWWRESRQVDWKAGKGFLLTGRQAVELGKLMQEAGNQFIHMK